PRVARRIFLGIFPFPPFDPVRDRGPQAGRQRLRTRVPFSAARRSSDTGPPAPLSSGFSRELPRSGDALHSPPEFPFLRFDRIRDRGPQGRRPVSLVPPSQPKTRPAINDSIPAPAVDRRASNGLRTTSPHPRCRLAGAGLRRSR